MKIYQITDIGEAEASTPSSRPSSARRVLYYLRKRSNQAASDDMIVQSVFNGDKSEASSAINGCLRAKAVRIVGG